MYIKKIAIILLAISLIFGVFGCKAIDVMKGLVSEDESDVDIVRSDEEEIEISNELNMRDTVLYFQNENGYLVPVKRQIPWEEGIAKAALRNMVDSSVITEDLGAIGLSPIVPAGTEVIGMAIDSETGLCKVDFTNHILNCGSEKLEQNMVRGIVYALTEFPAINEVQFMVEGKVVNQLNNGTNVSQPLKREDINLIGSAEVGASKVVVYYKGTSNGEYEYYVPVTVPTSAPAANVHTALSELFQGAPESSGLYTDIPLGASLQGVEISNGIAYVDLLLESDDVITSQREYDNLARNIGLTLKQFDEVAQIEILIDGKTVEEAGLDFSDSEGIPVFANEY